MQWSVGSMSCSLMNLHLTTKHPGAVGWASTDSFKVSVEISRQGPVISLVHYRPSNLTEKHIRASSSIIKRTTWPSAGRMRSLRNYGTADYSSNTPLSGDENKTPSEKKVPAKAIGQKVSLKKATSTAAGARKPASEDDQFANRPLDVAVSLYSKFTLWNVEVCGWHDGIRQRLLDFTIRRTAEKEELTKKLKRYGIAGILSYGLLNTFYYLVTFLFVWFYVAPSEGGLGLASAAQRFLRVFAMVWAGSQVTKLIRAAGALTLAPFVDRGLNWFTERFNFKSRGKAFGFIVGGCILLAASVFLIITALWA